MIEIFTTIYNNSFWGNNINSEYKGSSGPGSSINYNEKEYIPFLKNFIRENNIKTVVDLGCGDFICGFLIYNNLDIFYTGYDAYEKVIDYNSKCYNSYKYNFHHLDIFNNKEEIISGDLCILKDVLQHWEINYIYKFLDYLTINKKFKYILIINDYNQIDESIIDKKTFNQYLKRGLSRGLSYKNLPLKKYNIEKLLNYNEKEISLIKTI